MSLDITQIRTKVYETLGEPAFDLPNEDDGVLHRQILLASHRVVRDTQSSDLEESKLGTITSIADQQSYDVPAGQEVIEVYWGPSSFGSAVEFDPVTGAFAQVPQSVENKEINGYYWRSDDFIREQKITSYIESRYSWDVIGGKIYLYPVPSKAGLGIKYLYTLKSGSISDLGDDAELALIWLSCSYCCRPLANKFRGKGNAFTNSGVGDYDSSSNWADESETYMNLYKDEVGLE